MCGDRWTIGKPRIDLLSCPAHDAMPRNSCVSILWSYPQPTEGTPETRYFGCTVLSVGTNRGSLFMFLLHVKTGLKDKNVPWCFVCTVVSPIGFLSVCHRLLVKCHWDDRVQHLLYV